MRRVERVAWLLVLGMLTGCAAGPRPAPAPALRAQAHEAEATALRRYAQGDPAAAARYWAEAVRLYHSMDDVGAAERNRLQLAQTLLALGQAQAGLEQAALVQLPENQIAALLLQAQARLALEQADAAAVLLQRAQALCTAPCPERGRLLLMQARHAWAGADAAQAVELARSALPLLREPGLMVEQANAWRLLAAAALRQGQAQVAVEAAQQALALDRAQALPHKIAQDWLLLGEAYRALDPAQARLAYQRAYQVAQAAGLAELAQRASARSKEIAP